MKPYDPAMIEYARQAADLVAIVSGDVDLRPERAGTCDHFTGPCPFCPGGTDRFTVSRRPRSGANAPCYYCRMCGASGDAIDYVRRRDRVDFPVAIATLLERGGVPLLSPEELDIRRAEIEDRRVESERREAEHRAEAERHMAAAVAEADLQARLLARVDILDTLASEGVPASALVALGMGLGTHADVPALVIPWTVTDPASGTVHVRAVQYRALSPAPWRYRYAPGSRPTLFNADAVSFPAADEVIVVEGAKKAASVYGHGFTSVCALSSKNAWRPEWAAPFRHFRRVYVVLDPDARAEAVSVAQSIGSNARVVGLRAKPDDLLVMVGGDADYFARLLDAGRKAA
jgi:DNA primase